MRNSPSPSSEKPPPTDEQVLIYDKFRTVADNLLLNALAGTGKTTTLEGLIPLIRDPWLYLAFNKPVVEEAIEKLPGASKDNVKTFNGLGLKCWRDGNGKADTNPKKTKDLLSEKIRQLRGDDRAEASDAYFDLLTAISLSKHLGYVPEGKFTHARRLIDRAGLNARLERPLSAFEQAIVDDVLFTSIQASYAGAIDFDDQVYMPALFGGSFPRFPIVLVDERQDSSPSNYALLERCVKGRLVAVGDRWQSIYGFRGATTDGGDEALKRYNMTELPLSYSFRCPEAIVRAVHWRVPHMKWVKTGGTHQVLHSLHVDDIPDGAAIICRNNAPLARSAFALLSRKRSVSLAGSDIGPKIIFLLGKVGNPYDKRDDLIAKIDAWRDEKLEKANAPATILDTAECMKVFASWGNTCEQAIEYAKHIFKQRGKIELTTGHKAKGKEWDTVYHLDPGLIDMNDEQDRNLKYVITTRAKQECFEVNTGDLQWQ